MEILKIPNSFWAYKINVRGILKWIKFNKHRFFFFLVLAIVASINLLFLNLCCYSLKMSQNASHYKQAGYWFISGWVIRMPKVEFNWAALYNPFPWIYENVVVAVVILYLLVTNNFHVKFTLVCIWKHLISNLMCKIHKHWFIWVLFPLIYCRFLHIFMVTDMKFFMCALIFIYIVNWLWYDFSAVVVHACLYDLLSSGFRPLCRFGTVFQNTGGWSKWKILRASYFFLSLCTCTLYTCIFR